MRKIFMVCATIVVTMVACQKEASQVTNPVKNSANGVVTTSSYKGVQVKKDGYPYPNIEAVSGFADDDIGWFLDLGSIQNNFNSSDGPTSSLGDPNLYCGSIKTVPMYAGQNILMGVLAYANDATNLYITYTTNTDWYMSETHLYAGSLIYAPLSGGGTPSPGKFPIKSTFNAANLAQNITYSIPLSNIPATGLIVAAHASVLRVDIDGDIIAKETAWAAGTRFQSNKNWATYVIASLETCGGGGPVGDATSAGSND